MKVFLGGEGRTELGDWDKEAPYRPKPGERAEPGVLLRSEPEIVGAARWSSLRKYQVGGFRKGKASSEVQNVRRLALQASESGASLLVFTRDRDGDEQRQRDVEEGIEAVRHKYDGLNVVGAMAIEAIEAWILLVRGDRKAEGYTRPKDKLHELGIADTPAIVRELERRGLEAVAKTTQFARFVDELRARDEGS
ncbi:MAG: hypothetical protein IT378_26125 [Sandaracinaceae bacterium]|nr:hypothetical protein [Sandaracinaceae bacterium]